MAVTVIWVVRCSKDALGLKVMVARLNAYFGGVVGL